MGSRATDSGAGEYLGGGGEGYQFFCAIIGASGFDEKKKTINYIRIMRAVSSCIAPELHAIS